MDLGILGLDPWKRTIVRPLYAFAQSNRTTGVQSVQWHPLPPSQNRTMGVQSVQRAYNIVQCPLQSSHKESCLPLRPHTTLSALRLLRPVDPSSSVTHPSTRHPQSSFCTVTIEPCRLRFVQGSHLDRFVFCEDRRKRKRRLSRSHSGGILDNSIL